MASTSSTPAAPFKISDIYYVLFRHKWKIILCTVMGLGAAAAVYKLNPPAYQSYAKLFIRFVISEGRSVEPGENDTITMSPDGRGATVLNSELQIFTSRDLAETVARNIGPEKVLAGISDSKSLAEATGVIRSGLIAIVPTRSSTIEASISHPNPEMAQTIMREYVNAYLKRHLEIHRAAGMVGEFLAQETDQLRARLTQTEEQLRAVNAKAGVVSLEASKQAYADQMNRIRDAIFTTQAELAARISVYDEMMKLLQPSAAGANTAEPAPVPPAQVEAYQRILAQISQLRSREAELLNYFKEGSTRIQEVRGQIAEAEASRQQMVTSYPGLARVNAAVVASAGNRPGGYDAVAEGAQITALQARLKTLNGQMDQIRSEAANLDQLEVSILELRRRKELEETNYRRYAASLEQQRIKEAMGDGKVSNISIVQAATPAGQDWMPLRKLTAGIAAAGLVLGLAWAFVIELFLDHSIRRPGEVERTLRAPLFIAIPRLKSALSSGKSRRKLLPSSDGKPAEDAGNTAAGSDSAHSLATTELEPFHQTLRDRLISYFESINLRHKPKLIAVTGLGRHSGVTTTASGLARSLSETGEGNVLLVDMTQGQGSAQHFQRGTQIGLDQLLDTRNSAFVRDNLYVVSENSGGERLAKGLPQRFNQLVPKLKASDFDYIIFDMPPVNQISITPRLAQFMDMTLLVVESEKTDRHVAERAAELLTQAKTNVGVVLNKNKPYVPGALQQDREFLLGM